MGLLSDPIFLMGMGLLGERGQPRGLLTGLQLAQKGQYQNALMNNMQAQQALAQRKDQRVDDQQAALTRLAKASTATPIPGSGPISKNPKPAYALDPMAEDMAIGAPEIMQKIMEAKMVPVPPKVTDDMAEYNQAVKQGYEGSFEDWMVGLRKSGATNVTVNGPQEAGREELAERINREAAVQLMERHGEMVNYADSFQRTLDAEEQLNSGMFTGAFADKKLGVAKVARMLGFNRFDDDIKNTEAFASMMGNETAQVIKAFGSGTGLSDADREYAQKIAGGEIKLDEKSIRELLRIRRKYLLRGMNDYQRKVQSMTERHGDSFFPWDIGISIPEGYNEDGTPVNSKQADPSKMSDEELLRALDGL